MSPESLLRAAVSDLRDRLSGPVLEPAGAGYDEARQVFNAMIDRRPAAIAQCENPADVAAAITWARAQDLEISVRGGGHSVAGLAVTGGGLMIDLRRMRGVRVDPQARTARVAGGATMSHLDRATEPFGLAVTGGRVSTTGVGGFTLGGGSGWVERKFGLACDNLLSAELVTADGELITADSQQHPELFWALHGGGGNFGVATALTFRLHDLPVLTMALLLWPAEAGTEITRAYRDFMAGAPDEVGGGLVYLTGPPEEFVPEHLVGQLLCGVVLCYTGPQDAALPVFAPLLELGDAARVQMEMPYAEFQCMLDDPPGLRNYWSAEYLGTFPDEAAEAFGQQARNMLVPSPSQQALLPLGGALDRPDGDYPVPWRHSAWAVHPLGLWEDPADDTRAKQWSDGLRDAMSPWASGAVYLNFIGDEGWSRVVAGYGEAGYARLSDVKAQYDPANVFHLNHNVLPA
ncbi:FAD-binding oxidoreductase [Longispora albida]|uniref:FAD-binding oxidoreductase n=1 Tax=Longispora albida TaxID=203523 RepID=UPI0003636B45|nr:FAD-binding oxidoreductase [Longispora albida]